MARSLAHQMTGAPTGDLVDMGGPCRSLKITAGAQCWVRAPLRLFSEAAPTAPVASPAPAAGAEAADGWHQLDAKDYIILPPDAYGERFYQEVQIWELAAGLVQIEEVV